MPLSMEKRAERQRNGGLYVYSKSLSMMRYLAISVEVPVFKSLKQGVPVVGLAATLEINHLPVLLHSLKGDAQLGGLYRREIRL